MRIIEAIGVLSVVYKEEKELRIECVTLLDFIAFCEITRRDVESGREISGEMGSEMIGERMSS